METRAFAPLYSPSSGQGAGGLQASVTVAAVATGATASTVFPGIQNNSMCQIQIANTASAWAYVNFGVLGAVTAATVASSYPVAPGSVVVVSVNSEVTGASVILASGSGSVIFTRGEGL